MKRENKTNYGATSTRTITATANSTSDSEPRASNQGGDTPTNVSSDDLDNINYVQENSDQPDQPINETMPTIKVFNMIGYGLGHVFNDLCAGIWFSYTLLFMQNVLTIPAPIAGALVMLGQIGDALATPIVGILADRYGTKRLWHIAGTLMVFISFPMIFSICISCSLTSVAWQTVYFSLFILIFQFGWAIVQITHLAMIPELSQTQRDRSDLTAVRYTVSVGSNVIVYCVTWGVLHARSEAVNTNNIGPSDRYRFRDIALILTLIGLTMSVLFHFSLSTLHYSERRRRTIDKRQREVLNDDDDDENDEIVTRNREKRLESGYSRSIDDVERDLEDDVTTPILAASSSSSTSRNNTPAVAVRKNKNFLKSPLLYQNAFLYVFSRLFMTTSLVYMPLWLDERSWLPSPPDPPVRGSEFAQSYLTNDDKRVENLAIVPLISFLASFLASMSFKITTRLAGHQITYMLGTLICLGGCTWIGLTETQATTTLILYGVAILFGAGSSITMISSLCITADMIGPHTEQGGFIYSAVTFTDKLITGIVVVVIETIKCKSREECPDYYRSVLAYGCGIAAVLGLFTLATLKCTKCSRANTRRVRRRGSNNMYVN